MTGSGTLLDPYIIWDVTDLQNMNLDLTAYYELGGNIDASATVGWNAGAGFIPIGAALTPFTGYFDGKGYTITDLVINRGGTNDIGLFGRVVVAAPNEHYIQNVTLENVDITGHNNVGALVGLVYADFLLISSCHSSGQVNGNRVTGGMIGSAITDNSVGGWYINIEDCSSSCTVVATDSYTGGFIGEVWMNGHWLRCSASGNVQSDDHHVGGFSSEIYGGHVSSSIVVSYCYATGDVIYLGGGPWGYTGGFTGRVVGSASLTSLSNCYATGDVSAAGGDNVGGFTGEMTDCEASQCYATGDVLSGDNYVGGFIGEADTAVTSQCYATGDVNATGWATGGFVGDHASGSTSTDCYSKGNVSGNNTVGGFVGSNGNIADTITDCYSTGTVSGTVSLGGFCGSNGGAITDCFWNTETSGEDVSDGGAGLTTSEMQQRSNFPTWDFTSAWIIAEVTNLLASVIGGSYATLNGELFGEVDNDLYPYLRWQNVLPSNCSFEYGETVSFGQTTPAVSKTRGESFTATLAGLSAGRDYYFRAKASN